MAGLVPAIHVFVPGTADEDVDARETRGHDDQHVKTQFFR